MSLQFLINTAGENATSLDTASHGSTVSGYDINDVISGARSTKWRCDSSTSDRWIGYHFASDVTVTHYVIARADWLLTKYGTRVRDVHKNASNVWSLGSYDKNPLSSVDLMGVRAQDLCFSVVPASNLRGHGLRFDGNGVNTEARQISKFYACNAFNLGVEPKNQGGSAFEIFASGQKVFFIPQKGFQPFETEARLSMVFENVNTAKIIEFKNLTNLLRWPIFLYDDDASLWSHKLEHVIVDTFVDTIVGDDHHTLEITFQRLKHYE